MNELHLSAPHAGFTIVFKYGFNNEQGPCARVMVIDTVNGKTLETFVPVSTMADVAAWLHGTAHAHFPPATEVAPEPTPEVPKAEDAKVEEAKQEFAEKVADSIIKEVQKFDAAKKKKGKR